jgi:16S rRNA (guanine527-N7)-methyltransferase
VPVSRETEQRLSLFVELLDRWRRVTNLVSESTFDVVWTRHIADSAQLAPLSSGAVRWLDMGSGAGFPGLVVAILLADTPGAVVHCVESDQRKCAFLREVARVTGGPAIIHAVRIEALDPVVIGPVDAVSARAFAPLPATLDLAKQWLARGAVGLFPRGKSAAAQLEQVSPDPRYAIERIPSIVEAEGVILRVRMN